MPRCVHDGRSLLLRETATRQPRAHASRARGGGHLRGETGLELVRFVLFSDATHGVFADALGELRAER